MCVASDKYSTDAKCVIAYVVLTAADTEAVGSDASVEEMLDTDGSLPSV